MSSKVRDTMQITLDSTFAAIDLLSEKFDAFAAERHLSPEVCGTVQLALEEVISNIIKHGYHGEAARPIGVAIRLEDNQIIIDIEDSAPPFDPLAAPGPDLARPMADKAPGGLGIHLVKRIMSSVGYQYANGMNRLTLRKRLD